MSRRSKALAVLLRARIVANTDPPPTPPPALGNRQVPQMPPTLPRMNVPRMSAEDVKNWMQASLSMIADRNDPIDENFDQFFQGYVGLPQEERHKLLVLLARNYDVNRLRVHELMQQYLNINISHSAAEDLHAASDEEAGFISAIYRMEKILRGALKPMYAEFFERLNEQPGGLKFLCILRADLLELLAVDNAPSLRALDSHLKENFITWVSPAALQLRRITWDDPASLLEKIVEHEAIHPIRNLLDLRRRMGVGRRCFGYFHPALPGEPLVFIEVALLKDVASSIQDVLWDESPTDDIEAKCALFYSISSTEPGLPGLNLGKFLLKRVVDMLRKDMPHIQIFATLSPIPGFMKWLLSKLASQIKLSQTEEESIQEGEPTSIFRETILLPDEEKNIIDAVEQSGGRTGIQIFHDVLISADWVSSIELSSALKSPLMRLCARYLLEEKRRGRALDMVANFHLKNGALVEKMNWMADQSEKGIKQSAGIMVNYFYRLESIQENAKAYCTNGNICTSPQMSQYLVQNN